MTGVVGLQEKTGVGEVKLPVGSQNSVCESRESAKIGTIRKKTRQNSASKTALHG